MFVEGVQNDVSLPEDWTQRYNTTPVPIETFVETPRYTGAVYKASGWTSIEITQGRGHHDRHTKRAEPKRTSGCDPSERTGSEHSIVESTARIAT